MPMPNRWSRSCRDAGLRVEGDYRAEKMGYKIREAQLEKIPYMLVVGAQEMENGTVSVRARKEEKGGTKPWRNSRRRCWQRLPAGSAERKRQTAKAARPHWGRAAFSVVFLPRPPQNGQNSSCIRRAMARI